MNYAKQFDTKLEAGTWINSRVIDDVLEDLIKLAYPDPEYSFSGIDAPRTYDNLIMDNKPPKIFFGSYLITWQTGELILGEKDFKYQELEVRLKDLKHKTAIGLVLKMANSELGRMKILEQLDEANLVLIESKSDLMEASHLDKQQEKEDIKSLIVGLDNFSTNEDFAKAIQHLAGL